MKKQRVIRLTNDGIFIRNAYDSFVSLNSQLRFVKWHNELGLKPMLRLKQRRKGVIKNKFDILYYCGREKEDPKCLSSKETLSNVNHVAK